MSDDRLERLFLAAVNAETFFSQCEIRHPGAKNYPRLQEAVEGALQELRDAIAEELRIRNATSSGHHSAPPGPIRGLPSDQDQGSRET